MEQHGRRGLRDGQDRAAPPATGQGSTCHPETRAGVSTLCCGAGGAEKGGCKNGLGLMESVVGALAAVGFHSSLSVYLFKMEKLKSPARRLGLQSRLGYSITCGLKGRPHPECVTAFWGQV